MEIAIAALIGYLLGSIPFGLILTRLAGHGDIRQIGSGNIGATNVLRTGNKKLAIATLLLDALKGAALVATYFYFSEGRPYPIYHREWFVGFKNTVALCLGGAAVFGHIFPIWLKFKGGKGVATALGVFLISVPYAGAAACIAWLIAAFTLRISSLSAIIAMIVTPIATFVFYGNLPAAASAFIAALVVVKHHANIRRLLKGEEPKIGKKKDTA